MSNTEKILSIYETIKNNTILYFQPIVKVENGRVFAIEALTRYINGDKVENAGWLFKDLYELDMFNILDEKVLENVKDIVGNDKYLKCIKDNNVLLSINLSSKFLEDKVDKMDELTENVLTHLDNKNIMIEINERQELTDDILELIKHLDKFKIKIAIDDYGQGLSQLDKMKFKGIEFIKLDISLLPDDNWDDMDVEIFKGIIRLFKAMNKQIIVEGVETKEQHGLLKEVDVDNTLFAQGWYYSKAIDIDSMVEYINEHN